MKQIATKIVMSVDFKEDGTLIPIDEVFSFELVKYESITINSSVDDMISTCDIVIPFEFASVDGVYGQSINNIVLKPNLLSIELLDGNIVSIPAYATTITVSMALKEVAEKYNSPEFTDFRGIITGFERGENSFVIKCQDYLAGLKYKSNKFSTKSSKLIDIIAAIFSSNTDYAFKNPEVYSDIYTRGEASDTERYPVNSTQLNKAESEFRNAQGAVITTGIFEYGNNYGYFYIEDIELTGFTYDDYLTGVELLEKLKENYGIYTYIREMPVVEEYYAPNGTVKERNTSVFILHSGSKYFKSERRYSPIKASYPFRRGYVPVYNFNGLNQVNNGKNQGAWVSISSTKKRNSVQVATIDGTNIIATRALESSYKNIKVVTANEFAEARQAIASRLNKIEIKMPNLSDDAIVRTVLNKYAELPSDGIVGTFTMHPISGMEKSDKIDLFVEDSDYSRYYIDGITKYLNPEEGLVYNVTVTSKII